MHYIAAEPRHSPCARTAVRLSWQCLVIEIPILAVLVLLGVIDSVFAASFDCKQAQSRVEKMICADSELSELDEHLGRYYEGARMSLEGSEACLKTDQMQWLKSIRDACHDKTCVRTVYLNRLSELDALQPGANAIKYMTLPRRSTLVWIIPPVLAVPNQKAKPSEVTGTLVDEMAGNSSFEQGFVLRTKAGTTYPLVSLMFLDGKTANHLSVWAIFMARGHAAKDENGKSYFEPSRCVFIYRMP